MNRTWWIGTIEWILNYEWSETCSRNDMVFMSYDEFYDKYTEIIPDGDE